MENSGAFKKSSKRYLQDISLENLLFWTYQVQRAHLVIDRGVGLHALERLADGHEVQACDSLVGLGRIGLLGTQIDGGGVSADLHPDAEIVAEQVKLLTPTGRGLVEWYGKTGEAPDWRVDLAIIPVRDSQGNPVIVYDDPERRKPVCCLITSNRDDVMFRRRVYGVWREAMLRLYEILSRHADSLTSHSLLPIEINPSPWTPWIKDVDLRDKV